jgi:hypothetical protein
VVLVAAVGGIAAFSSGDEATATEIYLDGRDETRVGGRDPFAPPAINPGVTVPAQLASNPDAVPPPQPVGGAIAPTNGGEPGLYGGTRDSSVCDIAKLIDFLKNNADKATAWAGTLGVRVADIDSYVRGLTSVLLRADTRVTNHGFENGAATSVQAVLQAGTAVLVDKFGVPRVKCYCGNPLLEPVQSPQRYSGPRWQGFEPNVVQVVQPAPVQITVIVVVDVVTGQPFGRPVGTDGGSDENATLPPRSGPASTTTTIGSPTTTTLAPTTTTRAPSTSTTAPTAPRGNADTAVRLVRDALQRCIDSFGENVSGTADDLGYNATATNQAGVFNVEVSAQTGTERGSWRVDTATGDLTPIDQTAAEVGAQCPELA